ncbi:MAG: hypothetical protein GY768_09635 [Planctomycetaceae bacterium]|nr:hypothetical protein [Planctomycetaceae bacterium]
MNLDDSVSRQVGQNDVFTVLLDKMGDVFGIGTSDTGFNQVVDGSFIGTVAIAEYLPAVRLESDELHRQDSQLIGTGETQERPRRDPGETQEGILDPTIMVGAREMLTDLDLAGLADVCWQVVPES